MFRRLRLVAILLIVALIAMSFAGGALAIEPALAVVFGALLALVVAGRAHPVAPASFPAPSLLALVASGRMARASLPRRAR